MRPLGPLPSFKAQPCCSPAVKLPAQCAHLQDGLTLFPALGDCEEIKASVHSIQNEPGTTRGPPEHLPLLLIFGQQNMKGPLID